MSDGKPKRPARDSGRSKITPDEPLPSESAPAVVPESPATPEAAPAALVAVAEPTPEIEPGSAEPTADSVKNSWTLFAEVQAVLARGFEAMAVEVSGMARSGVATAGDAAVALLGAKTFAEAVEIQAGLAQRGVDAMIEGSAKLSEIGVTAMSEAARPILLGFGGMSSGAGLG